MATIYNIKTDEGTIEKLVSKDYVDYIAKQLEEMIVEHENDSTSAHKSLIKARTNNLDKSFDEEDIVLGNINNKEKVLASEIDEDSKHRFVSDALLRILKDKPTRKDMELSFDEIKQALKQYIDDRIDTIINTPDSIDKVKDLMNLIEEDVNMTKVLAILGNKVSNEDFNKHIESNSHLTNNDRKALNLLIDFISTGGADWNAKSGAANEIKNKPDSLPANGGNADTVGGYSPKDLVNKRSEDIIIGIEDESYDPSEVDLLVDKNSMNIDVIFNKIKHLDYGSVKIRKGNYIFNGYSFHSTDRVSLIIDGNDCVFMSINGTEIVLDNNLKLSNINFDYSDIVIKNDNDIRDCHFSNCNVIAEGSMRNIIKNCRFDNCTISFDKSQPCIDNIFTENIIKKCNYVKYLGGNNVINNNVIIKS